MSAKADAALVPDFVFDFLAVPLLFLVDVLLAVPVFAAGFAVAVCAVVFVLCFAAVLLLTLTAAALTFADGLIVVFPSIAFVLWIITVAFGAADCVLAFV